MPVPVRDTPGAIAEWLGTSTDIHDLRDLQARQGVMVAEHQHRTRHLITVVGAISRQTIDKAGSLDDFRHRFDDRLARPVARPRPVVASFGGPAGEFRPVAWIGTVGDRRTGRKVALDGAQTCRFLWPCTN